MRYKSLPALLVCGLIVGCADRTYTEAEFKRPAIHPPQCVSGDCTDGIGTLRFANGMEITGRRVAGKQVAGTYQVLWPCLRDKPVPITYETPDIPAHGTVVRECVSDPLRPSKPPRPATYTGTFVPLLNPFTRESVNSYKSGTYTDGRGVSWEGEFDYIPLRETIQLPGYGKTFLRSGTFVFVGTKIDTQYDEVTRGLFISEPTRPGHDIRFVRARPDYLESLRANFVADAAANATELAEEKRARQAAFDTILYAANTAIVAYGNARATAAVNRAQLESMTSLIRGAGSSSAGTLAPPQAAAARGLQPPSPISVAEYRRLQADSRLDVKDLNRRQHVQTASSQHEPEPRQPRAASPGDRRREQQRDEQNPDAPRQRPAREARPWTASTATAPAPTHAPTPMSAPVPQHLHQQLSQPATPPDKPDEAAVCVSWGHQLALHQSVCYANSMEQYRCGTWRKQYGLTRVQKLILKSSLADKTLCDHVDRHNDKPAADSLLEY